MGHKIRLSRKRAFRDLRTLPDAARRMVRAKLDALSMDPRPVLHAEQEGFFRAFTHDGKYVIIYTVDDAKGVVLVVEIRDWESYYKRYLENVLRG